MVALQIPAAAHLRQQVLRCKSAMQHHWILSVSATYMTRYARPTSNPAALTRPSLNPFANTCYSRRSRLVRSIWCLSMNRHTGVIVDSPCLHWHELSGRPGQLPFSEPGQKACCDSSQKVAAFPSTGTQAGLLTFLAYIVKISRAQWRLSCSEGFL